MIGNLHAMDRYAVGDKVYGSGTRTATAGHVDPTGYVERELRSRLAASVLDGQPGPGSGRGGAPVSPPNPNHVGETVFRSPMAQLARILIAKRRAR